MKNGEIVELIEDTTFYKSGTKAVIIREEKHNKNNLEIRYIGEKYIGGDVDIVPKNLLKVVSKEKINN